MGMQEQIQEYSKLFKEYYAERCRKIKEYKQKHNLGNACSINSIDHPNYFDIDKEWEARRKIIDEPILAMAKYKVNQELEFIKTNHWRDISFNNLRDEVVLSHGIVTHLHTSDSGSGEIIYCFEKVDPPCPEVNPHCAERKVICVYKSQIPHNVTLKNSDGYSFNDLLEKIDLLTEDNAKTLLSKIYSDSNTYSRSHLRIPIAKSHKKRLIKNLEMAWDKTDLEKLESLFQKCGLSIYKQSYQMKNTENKKQLPAHDKLNSLAYKNNNGVVIAVVLAKYWFKHFYDKDIMPYFITEDDYVVCKWHDFHDGEKSNIEGKETIAICRNREDADLLYNQH